MTTTTTATTTTNATALPQRPAPLSLYRINSPAEIRAFKDAEGEYFNALRRAEQAERQAAEQLKAEASRPLTENEYYLEACQRENERKEKAAAALAIVKANERAASDYAKSSLPVAEVMETSEFRFLSSVVAWANKGYTLQASGMLNFGLGLYHVQLDAPVKNGGKA